MKNEYPIRFSDQLRQYLRALRKNRDLTQAQAGELIGVSQSRIAEIESDPGIVNFEQVLKLLSVLGVTLSLKEDIAEASTLEQKNIQAELAKKNQLATIDESSGKNISAIQADIKRQKKGAW